MIFSAISPTVRVILPLKQGLRRNAFFSQGTFNDCQSDTSIKTRIKTDYIIYCYTLFESCQSDTSIKTRIKTRLMFLNLVFNSSVRVILPLKQGLRQF